MGFYPPATLVRDGQRRGVETRPPDVNRSGVSCTIENGAVRVGLKYVQGVGEDDAKPSSTTSATRNGPYGSIRDLAQRVSLSEAELTALVESGACDSFGLKRRELLWQLGLVPRAQTVPGSGGEEKQLALPLEPTVATPDLPDPTVWERMLDDYRTTSLSVGVHPLELMRPHLPAGTLSSVELLDQPNRTTVQVAGMVVARQRPSTANGVVFMLLEDEHAQLNLIVPPQVYDRFRALVRGEPLLLARGRYEHVDRNRNVLVRELVGLGRSHASSPTGRTCTARCRPRTTSATGRDAPVETLRDLAKRVRRRFDRAVLGRMAQAALAAGIAWELAPQIPGHTQPFFAPIAALDRAQR